jgi:hypothetical protein
MFVVSNRKFAVLAPVNFKTNKKFENRGASPAIKNLAMLYQFNAFSWRRITKRPVPEVLRIQRFGFF